jgi:hypothetical protein
MRSITRLACLGLILVGCAGTHRPVTRTAPPGSVQTVSCTAGPVGAGPFFWESGVYRAGPFTLAIGEDLAQVPTGRPAAPVGAEAIAQITAPRPVTVRVDPTPGVRFALQFTPVTPGHPEAVLADGRSTVRFPACAHVMHRFRGGVLFAGHGCVRLAVQAAGRRPSTMLIPIGNTLSGCDAGTPATRLPTVSLPFLGVACGVPNSIDCTRVGVGVSTETPARLVVVQIAGRLAALSPPPPPQSPTTWLGHLVGLSFRHGPLRIPISPRDHLWYGSPEVYPRVRVTAFFRDGKVATVVGTVLLHPGFG